MAESGQRVAALRECKQLPEPDAVPKHVQIALDGTLQDTSRLEQDADRTDGSGAPDARLRFILQHSRAPPHAAEGVRQIAQQFGNPGSNALIDRDSGRC